MHEWRTWPGLLVLSGPLACSDPLPPELADYRSTCVRMTCSPLPKRQDDPHDGVKHVYACGADEATLALNERPFADGVTIVKESMREDSDFAWLVATARKRKDRWRWDEYTRNFEGERFLHIAASESVCIDCHRKVRDVDYIYTYYDACDGG